MIGILKEGMSKKLEKMDTKVLKNMLKVKNIAYRQKQYCNKGRYSIPIKCNSATRDGERLKGKAKRSLGKEMKRKEKDLGEQVKEIDGVIKKRLEKGWGKGKKRFQPDLKF